MSSSNYSEELRLAGLSTPGKLLKQWDFTGGIGGPIIRDRIWYYATARDEGQHRTIPGIFPNLNAGNPNAWEYQPDTSRQARGAESFQIFSDPLHRSGDAAKQVQRALGMADPVQRCVAFTEAGCVPLAARLGRSRRRARARRPDGDHLAET